MGNIHSEQRYRFFFKRTIKMAQIIWYIREQFFANKSKKSQDSLKVYNGLNNDTDDDYDISNGDGVNIDEMMDDLEQISTRIIDDVNVFDSNNDDTLTCKKYSALEKFDNRRQKFLQIKLFF